MRQKNKVQSISQRNSIRKVIVYKVDTAGARAPNTYTYSNKNQISHCESFKAQHKYFVLPLCEERMVCWHCGVAATVDDDGCHISSEECGRETRCKTCL